jgi:hypothetical protein
MKLKQILSEIKLIPQNRILLKKDDDDYYFELKNKHLQVWKLELEVGYVSYEEGHVDMGNLLEFLDSKKIPYRKKIYEDGDFIRIDAKYFITPDKLNEIKLVKATKNSYLNKLLVDKELENRFLTYLEYDYFEDNKNWDNAQSFFAFFDWERQDKTYFNWKEQFKDITKEQIIEIIKYYKDKVNNKYGNELDLPK